MSETELRRRVAEAKQKVEGHDWMSPEDQERMRRAQDELKAAQRALKSHHIRSLARNTLLYILLFTILFLLWR